MQALILAAGKGKRMAGLTSGRPKSLLPFMGKTLIEYSMDRFAEVGVKHLVVVVGYERQLLVDFIRSRWKGSMEFVFNPLFESTNVIFSFWLALPYLHDDVFYLHADTVFGPEILRIVKEADEGDIIFPIDSHPCAEEEMKVRLEGDRVTLVTKKMAPEAATGEFIGLARLGKAVLRILRRRSEDLLEEGRVNEFFEAVVQRAIDLDAVDVRACDVRGLPWSEIDFPEDYERAKTIFDERL
jgi:choline kinase